jgi:hypothetical protein
VILASYRETLRGLDLPYSCYESTSGVQTHDFSI